MELVLLLPYARMILRNPLGVMMESQLRVMMESVLRVMMESVLRVMMESVLRVMMEPATHARNGPPKRRVMIVFGRRTGRSLLALFLAFSLSVVSESGALHVFWCRAFVCCRCCFSVFFFLFLHQFARETGGRLRESLLLLWLWLFCFFSSCVCRKFFQNAKQRREEKRREERKEGRLVENTNSFSCPFSLHRSPLLPSGFSAFDSFLSHPFLVSFFLLIPSFLPHPFLGIFLSCFLGHLGRRSRKKEEEEGEPGGNENWETKGLESGDEAREQQESKRSKTGWLGCGILQ